MIPPRWEPGVGQVAVVLFDFGVYSPLKDGQRGRLRDVFNLFKRKRGFDAEAQATFGRLAIYEAS